MTLLLEYLGECIIRVTVLHVLEKFVILQSIGIIVIKCKETRVITYTCRYSSGYLIPHSFWHYWIIGIECPLEYLQVYRWSPLFPYFLCIRSLLTVKLLIFLYTCLLAFFEITINISWCAPNKLLVENLLASMLRIHSFSAHYAAPWMENSMKSIPTINPAITENQPCGKYGRNVRSLK